VILGPYLVGQLCVALTYWFIYRLGRLLMDPIRAAAGTILMAGAYYFTVPTLEFNHNVIQLPLWSAGILLYAHLRQKPHSWLLWLGLGVLGGFGLYGKYTFAILLIILFCLSLFERPTRAMFKTARPYVSIALAIAVFHRTSSGSFSMILSPLPMRLNEAQTALRQRLLFLWRRKSPIICRLC